MPNTRTPSINSEVAIGRRIKGSEMLIGNYLRGSVAGPVDGDTVRDCGAAQPAAPGARGGRSSDTGALGQPILAIDHHPLARA